MIAGLSKNWRFVLALFVCVSVVFAWQYDHAAQYRRGRESMAAEISGRLKAPPLFRRPSRLQRRQSLFELRAGVRIQLLQQPLFVFHMREHGFFNQFFAFICQADQQAAGIVRIGQAVD